MVQYAGGPDVQQLFIFKTKTGMAQSLFQAMIIHLFGTRRLYKSFILAIAPLGTYFSTH